MSRHDRRVLAAHLRRAGGTAAALQLAGDRVARLGRAGEGDAVDQRVDQRAAGPLVALHEVDTPAGSPASTASSATARRPRRLLGRLHHDRVAGHERAGGHADVSANGKLNGQMTANTP